MDNRQTIQTYYECLAERRRDELLALLADDVRVAYHGPPDALPWIGEFRGKDGFDEFFATVASHCDIIEVTRTHMIADDDRVAVQCVGSWRIKANGRRVDGHMINVFGIADGRIASYEVYADTAAFVAGMSGAA